MPTQIQLTSDANHYFKEHYREDSDSWCNASRCWSWTGTKNENGYGELRVNNKKILAHRYSVVMSGRKISDDLVVDHLCERPECVNPLHLEIVTQSENAKRIRKRRQSRSESNDYAPTSINENQAMYAARIASETRGEEYIDNYLCSIRAQVTYWGVWKLIPLKAKRCFEKWKEGMKVLMVFSDQLITDIEAQRRKYMMKGISLSRLGTIRILLKEALAIRAISTEETQREVDNLVAEYDVKLRLRGARADGDPAAPPDGRKPRALPDGSEL